MELKGIKNIIFDFGGIIIDIDYEAVRQAFIKIGMEDPKKYYEHEQHSKLVEDFECGLISADEFRQELISNMNAKVDFKTFDDAWNSIIKTIPQPRVELIDALRKKYKVFLLSNTNCIHYAKYTDDFKRSYNRELIDLFDKAYFSYQMKLRKPDIKIFETVLIEQNIDPKETIFIDDSKINIEAAKLTGMNIFYKPQKDELIDYFI